MDQLESKFFEAVKNSLRHEVICEESVLADMLKQVKHDQDETSHHSQFRWEGIDDAFNLKLAGNPYKDSITSAFYATHTYKYLDDPIFKLAFEKDLRQRAVPESDIQEALKHVDALVEDLKKDPGERDSGWSPVMNELVDVTSNADNRNPKADAPYTGGGLYPEDDKYEKGNLEGFETKELKLENKNHRN